MGIRSYQGNHTSTQRGSRSLSEWKVSLGRGLRAGEAMKIGDLVYWHDKKSLLGIVIEVTKAVGEWDVQGVRVQWANGVPSNHSSTWIRLIETSEDT